MIKLKKAESPTETWRTFPWWQRGKQTGRKKYFLSEQNILHGFRNKIFPTESKVKVSQYVLFTSGWTLLENIVHAFVETLPVTHARSFFVVHFWPCLSHVGVNDACVEVAPLSLSVICRHVAAIRAIDPTWQVSSLFTHRVQSGLASFAPSRAAGGRLPLREFYSAGDGKRCGERRIQRGEVLSTEVA